MNSMTRTAGMIAAEINVIKAQAREVVCRSAIEIGRRLYEAKSIVPHGGWGAWLAENVDYSERTAQNLMRVYEEYGRNANPQAIADLSYTRAVILLGLDRESRAKLMESAGVAAMSTRDLQAEVDRLNEEKAKQQVRIDELLGDLEKADEKVRDAEAVMDGVNSLQKERDEAVRGIEIVRQQATDLLERARKAENDARSVRAELEAERGKPEPLPVVEKVEVVPPAVEAELNALREKVRRAPNEKEVLLREAYRVLAEQFKTVEQLIYEVEEGDTGAGERFRAAVAKAARMMADRLVGGA